MNLISGTTSKEKHEEVKNKLYPYQRCRELGGDIMFITCDLIIWKYIWDFVCVV